jgi:hypothetical protein
MGRCPRDSSSSTKHERSSSTVFAGHQDWKTPIHKLSLLAKLKVEADALTTKYQMENCSHKPNIPLTDWAGGHLNLPSGTVTFHYEASLRFQATGPPLQAYMMKKYDWTLDTWKYINWRVHEASIKKILINTLTSSSLFTK